MTFLPHDGAHRPGSVARPALLGLLLLTFVLGLLVAPPAAASLSPGAGTAAVTLAPDDTDGVSVTLVSQTPTVFGTDDTLRVTVLVRNGTDRTVEQPRVVLGVNRNTLDSRSMLSLWADADVTVPPAIPVPEGVELLDPLPAGAETEVTFTADATDVGLSFRPDWGPRALSVTVHDGATRLAVMRSYLLWTPTDATPPVRLSVLSAVVGPPLDAADPETTAEAVSAELGPGGRLDRLLTATADVPEVGWVVDPTTVALAETSEEPAVRAWARDLLAATEGRDTYALDGYDPDLAAYAHAELPAPRRGPDLPGGSTTTESWPRGLWWPADEVPDQVTLDLAAEHGKDVVVVRGDALTPTDVLTYTPTGLAEVSTASGDLTAVVADDVLTGLLTDATRYDPTAEVHDAVTTRTSVRPTSQARTTAQALMIGSGSLVVPALAAPAAPEDDTPEDGAAPLRGATVLDVQRLLAETAVIARERPADERHVSAVLPRDWDPSPDVVTAVLSELRAAPWVDFAPTSRLLETPVPDLARTSLPDVVVDETEISRLDLRTLRTSRQELTRFASVTEDPESLTGPLAPAFVSPASIRFREDTTARSAAVRYARRSVQTVLESISVVPGSDINLISASGQLPVRLRNELDQDVTVQVHLIPDDTRLDVLRAPLTTVPAGGDTQVDVPVRAIGSGNVTVDVELVSEEGTVVAQTSSFMVRVRADWETVGTGVVAGLLALALVVGVWRTIRRGRSPRRAAGAVVDQPQPAGEDPR